MYSRWVDWLLTPGDNSKYLLAIRIVGGDPISDIKNLGLTFFLTNGWRIVPESLDYRLTLIGNLVTDPSGFSPIDAVPGYSIIVEYSVSNLVDSTLAQMPEIEYASFNGGVAIDVVNGTAGTGYPLGTMSDPVNNLADAKFIANLRGFHTLYIIGDLTIGATDDISDYTVIGEGAGTFNLEKTVITLVDGCTTSFTTFKYCKVQGKQNGETIYSHCVIGDITNAHCQYHNCAMVGPVQCSAASWTQNHTTDLKDCYSSYDWYVVDYNNSPLNQVYSNFSGKIKFINVTDSRADIIINLDAGSVWLDSTCTDGNVTIRGTGVLVNDSVLTPDTTALLYQGSSGLTAQAVWEYSTRAITDKTGFAPTPENIWQHTSRTLTQSLTGGITAQEIWEYNTRTLTQLITGGATPSEIWGYAARALTDKSGFAPTEVDIWGHTTRTLTQAITGGGASAAEVWEHSARTLTAGTRDTEIDAIKVKTDNLPGGIKKNVALPYFTFSMISSTDGKSLLPGLVVSAQRKLDSGAFAVCVNAPVGIGNGVYLINLEATDMDGTMVTLKFTAVGALDRVITIKTNP